MANCVDGIMSSEFCRNSMGFLSFSDRFPIAVNIFFELILFFLKIHYIWSLFHSKDMIIPYGLKYIRVTLKILITLLGASGNRKSVRIHRKWSEFHRNTDNSDIIIPIRLKKSDENFSGHANVFQTIRNYHIVSFFFHPHFSPVLVGFFLHTAFVNSTECGFGTLFGTATWISRPLFQQPLGRFYFPMAF